MNQEKKPILSQTRRYKIFADHLDQQKAKDKQQTIIYSGNPESDSRNSFRNTQKQKKISTFLLNDKQKRCLSLQNNSNKAYSYNIKNHITTEPCSNLIQCNLLASRKSEKKQAGQRKRTAIFGQNYCEGRNENRMAEKLIFERKSIFGHRNIQKRNQSLQISGKSPFSQLSKQQEPKELQIQNYCNQGQTYEGFQTKRQFTMQVINQLPQKQCSIIQEPHESLYRKIE